ncbi:MAG TPA: SMC-Scp complex subunit ScpB [Candidatus Nanoarchaeia archaeon]|nr:SMC-Scp complex subunit ScpB [Candidatus Nanoarchaeia archaeon]
MQDVKNKAEAVLFMTGRFMAVEEIATFCNVASVGLIKDALQELTKEYAQRSCGLDVVQQDGKYKLDIKKDYHAMTTKLVSSSELDAPVQATLAVIAYKQPALQAEIVKMRGNSAYDHIKALKEAEFIVSERKGRTRLLKLTQKFFDYFNIVEAMLPEKFRAVGEKQEQLAAAPVEEKKAEPIPVEEKKEEPLLAENKPAVLEKKPRKRRSPHHIEEQTPLEPGETIATTPVEEAAELHNEEPQLPPVCLDADDFGTPTTP